MQPFQYFVTLALTAGLALSLSGCGSGGGTPTTAVSEPIPDVVETIPVEVIEEVVEETVKENVQVLFTEDIAEELRQSTPTDINLPLGLQATFDIEYLGAFRALASGESNSNYAVGTLGFNPDNNSIFMAGHDYHGAIAEFEIPAELSFAAQPSNIIEAAVLQQYEQILGKKEIGNSNNKINGMLFYQQNLLVSSEIWYDGNGSNLDNLQVFSNAFDVSSSAFKGMLQVNGGAKAAGYMFAVPAELTEKVGTEYLIGWASNYSITSRYSQGPSLYRFDPNQAIDAVLSVDRTIDASSLMVFPLADGKELVAGGDEHSLDVSPIWGPLAKVKHGFIIPGTTYFLAIGYHSGLHYGSGYKITQSNGNVCDGGCSYEIDDKYNYFWIFDVNDMLEADEPWLVQPISYGKWSHPYDNGGANQIIGGTYDDEHNILYLTIYGAGQTGDFDRPPLIISYQIKAKQ